MQKTQIFVALYDAVHELAHFADPELLTQSRALGTELGRAGFGGVARAGSPTVSAALSAMAAEGQTALVLSPAATEDEHVRAFRLPKAALPMIYTGRGALGADVVALASGKAVIVIGSDEEALLGVLGCVDGYGLPVGILTGEAEESIRAIVRSRYPSLLNDLFVASEPRRLADRLKEEVRRHALKQR